MGHRLIFRTQWPEWHPPSPETLPLPLLSSQVASKAGIYEILNELGFPELESGEDQPFSRLRYRWQAQSCSLEPSAPEDLL